MAGKKNKKKKKKKKGATAEPTDTAAAAVAQPIAVQQARVSNPPPLILDAAQLAAATASLHATADEIERLESCGPLSKDIAAVLRNLPPQVCADIISAGTRGGQKLDVDGVLKCLDGGAFTVEEVLQALTSAGPGMLPQVVTEARELCEMVGKLRFKDDSLQVRLERIMEPLHHDAWKGSPPNVSIAAATHLWHFLQTAQKKVADRHAALTSSLLLTQTKAARCKTVDRQRVSGWVGGWVGVVSGASMRRSIGVVVIVVVVVVIVAVVVVAIVVAVAVVAVVVAAAACCAVLTI